MDNVSFFIVFFLLAVIGVHWLIHQQGGTRGILFFTFTAILFSVKSALDFSRYRQRPYSARIGVCPFIETGGQFNSGRRMGQFDHP
jgi:hypothetical protein